MATDLFGKYFTNPKKSYIYTQMICNGPSADEMSFDIMDRNGVISNNEEWLSAIDLADVHVPCTQYTNDMKVIDPHGLIYIKGIDKGGSYTTKAFGKIPDSILAEDENWLYNTALVFHIKYVNERGVKVIKCVKACGSYDDEKTIIDACQEIFDDAKIPVNVKYDENYVYFTSTVLGWDFWISLVELWFTTEFADDFADDSSVSQQKETSNNLGFGYDDEWIETNIGSDKLESIIKTGNAYKDVISESDYRTMYDFLFEIEPIDSSIDASTDSSVNPLNAGRVFLFEDMTKYVPAQKYRNGAMKGCVVKATYPIYNASNITESMRSLKIVHLMNRIEDYVNVNSNRATGLPLYAKVIRDVVDSYYSQYEYDIYNKWSMNFDEIGMTDDWIDPEDVPCMNDSTELYMGDFKYKKSTDMPSLWAHSMTPSYYVANTFYKAAAKYEAVGLYGFATYATRHNLWMNMGQLYIRTTVDDDESLNTRNMISSFIIYNPNDFPVTVNYMTFA